MPKYKSLLGSEARTEIVPEGLCHCGCGQKTNISVQNHRKHGWIRGEPFKFAKGHSPKWQRRIDSDGYVRIREESDSRNIKGYVREHNVIAEKALGKPLPTGAIVHHANGKKNDNSRGNHVICQDQSYHKLLHQRMRAYKACGHANWRSCKFCHQYDDPKNLKIRGKSDVYHRICENRYMKSWYHKNKEK